MDPLCIPFKNLLDTVLEFGKLKVGVQVLAIRTAKVFSIFRGILYTDYPGTEQLKHGESR
jgi:hypothetical protein